MRSTLLRTILAFLVVGAFASSCDENNSGPDPDELPAPDRSSADKVLTDWFEKAYTRKDSVLYESMLDDAFQFEFLPEDADSLRDALGQFNYWTKPLDLRSTGNLFKTAVVTEITLGLDVVSNDAYEGNDCAGCRTIETTAIIRVGTTQTIGGTPRVLAIDSPQIFVVKPDPADPTQWVIWRQFDRPRGLKRMTGPSRLPASEGTNWGDVKGLFFGS